MKHATVSPSGVLTGLYDDANHDPIPTGTIALTDDQFAQWNADHTAKVWVGGALQDAPAAPLAVTQSIHSAGLRIDCASYLLAGFPSIALGAPHTYPSTEIAQRNLAFAATLSLSPGLVSGWVTPLWCADVAGAWALQAHNPAQVQHAAADWLAYRTAAQTRLADLLAAVAAAPNAAASAAVTW